DRTTGLYTDSRSVATSARGIRSGHHPPLARPGRRPYELYRDGEYTRTRGRSRGAPGVLQGRSQDAVLIPGQSVNFSFFFLDGQQAPKYPDERPHVDARRKCCSSVNGGPHPKTNGQWCHAFTDSRLHFSESLWSRHCTRAVVPFSLVDVPGDPDDL